MKWISILVAFAAYSSQLTISSISHRYISTLHISVSHVYCTSKITKEIKRAIFKDYDKDIIPRITNAPLIVEVSPYLFTLQSLGGHLGQSDPT